MAFTYPRLDLRRAAPPPAAPAAAAAAPLSLAQSSPSLAPTPVSSKKMNGDENAVHDGATQAVHSLSHTPRQNPLSLSSSYTPSRYRSSLNFLSDRDNKANATTVITSNNDSEGYEPKHNNNRNETVINKKENETPKQLVEKENDSLLNNYNNIDNMNNGEAKRTLDIAGAVTAVGNAEGNGVGGSWRQFVDSGILTPGNVVPAEEAAMLEKEIIEKDMQVCFFKPFKNSGQKVK